MRHGKGPDVPALTVIVSALHASHTIQRTLRTTLRALPKDAEVVVAVDGPDPDTATAACAITDPRVRVIEDEINLGTAARHQVVLQRTDSEFVANMDADDLAFPWRFKPFLGMMRTFDAVFAGAIRFGAGIPRPSYPIGLTGEELDAALLFCCPVYHSSLVARRSVLLDAGGYRPIRHGEDYELWVRLAARGARLHKAAYPSIGYRLSPGQLSGEENFEAKAAQDPRFVESFTLLAQRLGVRAELREGRRRVQRSSLQTLLAGYRGPVRRYLQRQAGATATIVDSM